MSDNWRPYTIPHSGEGAVRRSDGHWVPSSQALSAPLAPHPHINTSSSLAAAGGMGSMATMCSVPSAAMNTTATATASTYTTSVSSSTAPTIPCLGPPTRWEEAVHPRFARDKGPGAVGATPTLLNGSIGVGGPGGSNSTTS